MPKIDGKALYEKIKYRREKYDEAKHCAQILEVMADKDKGCFSEFCAEIGISDKTFWNWVNKYEILAECYGVGTMMARVNWNQEGREIKDEINMPGVITNKFEHWKMMGWARYGIGKVNRIRLNLDAQATPDKHYAQLLEQASHGAFTAGEVKQLMEAINVGLNTHQVFQMQKEIEQLRADLAVMNENTNGNDSIPVKGLEKKD